MTTAPTFELTPFLGCDEGQHFDRKSVFEGEGKKRPRDRRRPALSALSARRGPVRVALRQYA